MMHDRVSQAMPLRSVHRTEWYWALSRTKVRDVFGQEEESHVRPRVDAETPLPRQNPVKPMCRDII